MERRAFLKLFSATGALIIPGIAPAIIHNAMRVRVVGMSPLLAAPYAVGEVIIPIIKGVVSCGWTNDFKAVRTFEGQHFEYGQMTRYYRQFPDGGRETISYSQYLADLAQMHGGKAAIVQGCN